MNEVVTRRERVWPTPAEVRQAKGLLSHVPPASYEWTSDEGQKFLAYAADLVQRGVPVSWLADQVGLDAPRLYAVLSRYRRSIA